MDEYNQNYQLPPQPSAVVYEDPNRSVMSVVDWVLTIVVLMIPCVGLIMYIVWAFGNGNENRKNFCRAYLIIALVSIALCVILGLVFGAMMASMINSFAY